MEVHSTDAPLTDVEADAIVIGLFAEETLSGPAAVLDEALGGRLTKLFEAREVSPKTGDTAVLLAAEGVKAPVTCIVGLGEGDEFDRGTAFKAAGAAAMALSGRARERVAFYLDESLSDELTESAVCGAMVGATGQDLYRTEKERHPPGELLWSDVDESGLSTGAEIGESVNFTRRLVNEPAGNIYPVSFAQAAADMAKLCGLEIEVWDEERLKAERCGALLGVAQGSEQPPRLVILRHQGGAEGDAPLALVGKGVTFDSGGLSIKPSDGMKTMKCDMAGAATVVGAMRAIAKLNLPVNVVGLVGLVENMVSGRSYKLGDVLTSRSGKTIEVLNTDAEGRLVLADVLNVAVEHKPAGMIDLATLTGACVVALGTDVAGAMTNNDDLCDALITAAESCGEPIWELPMFPEFAAQIKSQVADIKNIGEGRWGGAITAAKFLEEFVDDVPWTHIDIAGPAFLEKPKPWQDAGGSGAFVRTLVEVAREWKTN